MKQTTLTQSGAPGRVICWTNFLHKHSMHGLRRNFRCFTGFVDHLYCSFWWVGLFFVYSCHSIMECYNLFPNCFEGVLDDLSQFSLFVCTFFHLLEMSNRESARKYVLFMGDLKGPAPSPSQPQKDSPPSFSFLSSLRKI